MYKVQRNIFDNHQVHCWKCDHHLGPLFGFAGKECPKCGFLNSIGSPVTEGWFRFWRDEDGHARSNLSRFVTLHSPSGFEWGYAGSGPADLALNMVEYVLVNNRWTGERSRGDWYDDSELLHQQVKWDFIARLPEEGGRIDYREFERYVMEHINAKQER